jgi:hypothetical protein
VSNSICEPARRILIANLNDLPYWSALEIGTDLPVPLKRNRAELNFGRETVRGLLGVERRRKSLCRFLTGSTRDDR